MFAGTLYKACLLATTRSCFVPSGDWERKVHALAGQEVPCTGPIILPAHEGREGEPVWRAYLSCACSCLANTAWVCLWGSSLRALTSLGQCVQRDKWVSQHLWGGGCPLASGEGGGSLPELRGAICDLGEESIGFLQS